VLNVTLWDILVGIVKVFAASVVVCDILEVM